MKRKLLSLMLSAAMVLTLAACGDDAAPVGSQGGDTQPSSTGQESSPEQTSSSDSQEETGGQDSEPVVIRYGTHWLNELDPNHTDDVTGEYTMADANRQAALAGLAAIKEAYNVEFEFLQYPVDVQSDLMTSVLAGDPICDIAHLWGGVEPTILAQNVLQDLTPYKDLFEGEEASWLLKDSLFGGYYLLNNEFGMTNFPLVVNMTMLEKVDSLKDENGDTIYPTDLFEKGEWTWSAFKDYLQKVQAYYANVDGPDGAYYDKVQAYETDFRYAALAAMHANGGAIYAGEVSADSEEAVKAVQFIEELMDEELLTVCGLYDDGYTPEWTRGSGDFGLGGTVFTDCASWLINWEASQCADRGESIGIIPWPMPDGATVDSETYKQSTNGGDSVAILKGVSEEKTELALKAFILYWQTYYKTLGGVDSIGDYQAAAALTRLADFGVDLYNEKYGDALVDCYAYILGHINTNYANLMGLWENGTTKDRWTEILGKSLEGVDGMSSYDVAIKANISSLKNSTEEIASILKTEGVHDNQKPNVTKEDIVLAAGTDAEGMDWTQYFTAEDSVDGVIAITMDNITVSEELDLAVPGEYNDALVVKVSDAAGNENEEKVKVTVYNPENTEAPTLQAKEELPEVAVNTETSGINWQDYLESAVDADGLDVKASVTADLSELDTTTPGSYDVVLTVTDYAGNTGEITVTVTVK